MQAMRLAAGLGTRLKPVTDSIPKALVRVNLKEGGDQPLLEGLLDKMIAQGFTSIVINIHHLGGQIRSFVSEYLERKNLPAKICFSDESDLLLGTGGAIKHACPFFIPDFPLLVHNVDILSDLNLRAFVAGHNPETLATLLVSERVTDRQLIFDKEWQLIGWTNIKTKQYRWVKEKEPCNPDGCILRAFSGIYILSPEAMPLFEQQPDVFSIIDFFLETAANYTIKGVEIPGIQVLDIGKPETLKNTLL